jgi:hypothetical protein
MKTCKTCNNCNITKPITEYHKDNKLKCGYRGKCKECTLSQQTIQQNKIFTSIIQLECSDCKIIKDTSMFYKCKKGKNGFFSYCKNCHNIRRINNRKQKNLLIDPKKIQLVIPKIKNPTILISKTPKIRVPMIYNKSKKQEYDKRYYNNNKMEILKKQKQYRETNKHIIQIYIEKNKERINKRERNRYLTDFNYKVKQCMRSRIRKLVNTKSKTTFSYIGCDIFKYKMFLCYQFTDKYNFNNYGHIWQIDHVTPCASFDLTKDEEIKKCFNWKNCRPLCCADNNSKNDKIECDLINSHKKVVNDFEWLWDIKIKISKELKCLSRN